MKNIIWISLLLIIGCFVASGQEISTEDFESGDLERLPWVTYGSGTAIAEMATDKAYSGDYSVKLGGIGNSQSVSLELNVHLEESGEVWFYRWVSAENCDDHLRFYVDGEERGRYCNNGQWAREVAPVEAGTHQLRWLYVKDSSLSRGEDAAWLDDIYIPGQVLEFGSLTALQVSPGEGWNAHACEGGPITEMVFRDYTLENTSDSDLEWRIFPNQRWATQSQGILAPGESQVVRISLTSNVYNLSQGRHNNLLTFIDVNRIEETTRAITLDVTPPCGPTEDFESGDLERLPWVTYGSGTAIAEMATDKAYSGDYSVKLGGIGNSQSVSLELNVHLEESGEVWFYRWVSAENCDDHLRFYVDGEERGRYCNNGQWAREVAPVEAGTHQLRWLYVKDSSLSRGEDAAWLDDIYIPGQVLEFGSLTALQVSPGEGWNAHACEGGPITEMVFRDYTLENTSDSDLEWRIFPNQRWATQSQGILAPGESQVVRISLTSNVYNLSQGRHNNLLTFIDVNRIEETTRAITLDVTPPCGPTEDFESGDLERLPWVTYGSGTAIAEMATDKAYSGDYSVKLGGIGNSQSVSLELNVHLEESGEVWFYRWVSAENCDDHLRFYVDGEERGRYCNNGQWAREVAPVEAGTHQLRWLYVKDSSLSRGEDAAWLDDIYIPGQVLEFGSLTALQVSPGEGWNAHACEGGPITEMVFRDYTLENTSDSDLEWRIFPNQRWATQSQGILAPGESQVVRISLTSNVYNLSQGRHNNLLTFIDVNRIEETTRAITLDVTPPCGPTEDFESGDLERLPWVTYGSGTAIAEMATDKAYSGDYSVKLGGIGNSQSVSLELNVHLEESGEVWFYRWVSAENCDDHLRFYVDGEERGRYCNNGQWAREVAPVEAGTHQLRWLYVKDSSLSRGEDAAWLDDIYIPGQVLEFGSLTALQVSPGEGWNAHACEGGPITEMVFRDYTLENTSDSDLEWRIFPNQRWATQSQGILAPGESQVVRISLTSNVYNLSQGRHNNLLTFIDVNRIEETTRAITLDVTPPCGPTEDFESGDLERLPWVTYGSGTAIAEMATDKAYSGDYSVKLGGIGNSQSVSLELNVHLEESGEVWFYRWVSAENCDDHLRFYVDGEERGRYCNNGQWAREVAPVEAGTHQLRWLYVKDSSLSRGEDAAWLDDIYIPEPRTEEFEAEEIEFTQPLEITSSFMEDENRKYYVTQIPRNGHLRFILDDKDDVGFYSLYVRHGDMPSLGKHDYRSTDPTISDQYVFVPNAMPGPWYFLVFAQDDPPPGEFSLQIEFLEGIVIESISPLKLGNISPGTISIYGADFTPSCNVSLINGNNLYEASNINYIDKSNITAEFNLPLIPAGQYNLRVSLDDQFDEKPFEILEGGEANLEVELTVPDRLGYHNLGTLYGEYTNTGNVAMPAPLLVLRSNQNNREAAIMTLDHSRLISGFWTSALPEGFSNTLQFLGSGDTPGLLQPGESIKVPMYWAGWQKPWDFSYPPISFSLDYVTIYNSDPIDWYSLKNKMRPDSINQDAWNIIWANFVYQVGSTWGDYVEMLSENAVYLSQLGYEVNDIEQLLAFEFLQANGLNIINTLSTSTDSSVQAPGMSIIFQRTFPQSISGRYRIGTLGRGWYHNWDRKLEVGTDGTVCVLSPSGSSRIFQPDSRNSNYFSGKGDHGVLTRLDNGTYLLREADGIISIYGIDGKIKSIEDPNGNCIIADYSNGRLVRLTHSSGQELQIEYNAIGNINRITDDDGRQTNYTYDSNDEYLVNVRFYDGTEDIYVYYSGSVDAAMHALIEIQKTCCSHQYITYDDRGRIFHLTKTNDQERYTFSYDSLGTVSIIDSLNNTTKFYLDHRGLLSKIENPNQNVIHFFVDDDYNLKKITDPVGNSYMYEYDDDGNLILSTDTLGNITRFGYEKTINQLCEIIDANGNITIYEYDTNSNLKSITYDDGSIEQWDYENIGLASSWTNRRGQTIKYEYDVEGNLLRKIYPDNSTIEFKYDTRGNLIETYDPTGTTTYEYDENDYLRRINFPLNRYLHYTYHPDGKRASMENQLGYRINYYYDSLGRLEILTDESNEEIVHYEYDNAGRMKRKTLGNGVYTTYVYDAAGQLLVLANYMTDNSFLSVFEYSYDQRGRRKSMNTLDGLWEYDYDDIGQLIGWKDPEGNEVRFEYDPLGNRITETKNGIVTNYRTNGLNQYTQVGDTIYTYDADGNMVKEISLESTINYIFNEENKLVEILSPDNHLRFIYNALGDLAQQDIDDVKQNLINDPIGFHNLVSIYNQEGIIDTWYNHGYGLVSEERNGTNNYYSYDSSGNVVNKHNGLLSIINQYNYKPFGELDNTVYPHDLSFSYIGEFGVQVKMKNKYHMRNRFYDSKIGRFISPDPIQISSGDLNFYRYVSNSPLNIIDPIGLKYWCGDGWCFDDEDEEAGNIEYPDPVKEKDDFINDMGPLFPLLPWIVPFLYPDIMPGGPPLLYPVAGLPSNWFDLIPSPIWIEPPTDSGSQANSDIAKPIDPNNKININGYGNYNFIQNNTLMIYRLNFENDESATDPAQIVEISDTLNDYFEWNTFELTEIGFGDKFIKVPEKTQHYEWKGDLSYNGVEFEVQINAGIKLNTG